jgi:two-component system OmpR family sensor kinase
VLTATLLFFSGVLYFSLRARLWKNLDPALLAMAQTEVASAVDDVRDGLHIHEVNTDLMATNGFHRLVKYVQIVNSKGTIVVHTRNLDTEQLPVLSADLIAERKVIFQTIELMQLGQLRMVSMGFVPPAETDEWVIQLATSTQEIEMVLHQFLWFLATLATGTLVVTCFGGVFLADRALKPIIGMTQTAREITEHNLNLRLARETDDEIGHLARVLNDMLDRLQQAFEALRRFTANASHEIRSPLTALKGDIEVTLRRERSPEEYRQVLSRSLEEVNRLSRMATNLLLLARADSGRLAMEQVYLPLLPLCQHVLDAVKPRCQKMGVFVSVLVDPHLAVWGDAEAMERLLLNLVDNSLHHIAPTGTINIEATCENQEIVLMVTDSGSGIAPADQAHVFERFYRTSEARSGHYEGSGLGLSICKEIVEAHNGSISVVSPVKDQIGTRFVMRLPAAD